MPQNKLPLLYNTTTRAVFEDVKRHLRDKRIEVPPEWKSLVVLGCMPFLAEPPPTAAPDAGFCDKTHKLLLRDFQHSFRHLPDLTLEILRLARRRFNHYSGNSKSKAKLVVQFILGNPLLIKEAGRYRPPVGDELDILWDRTKQELTDDPRFKQGMIHPRPGKTPIKSVPIYSLMDGEIALLLTGFHGFHISTDTVRMARRSLTAADKTKGKV